MVSQFIGENARRIARLRLWAVLAFGLAVLAGWTLAAEPEAGAKNKGNVPAKPTAKQPAPLSRGVRAEKDIPYVPGGDEAQRLDLYLPEQAADSPLPLIVCIHGGGWRGGSKAWCPMAYMVGRGCAVASVEYRFSQKAVFPAQIQDCQAAIRWLRANRKKYNFDPDHIGVIGASAGGHLVALLGTAGGKKAFAPIGGNEEQSDRVQAVCDYYGPTDFNTVMQQAADDKNVKNIFQFNTPSDPYSGLIGVSLGSDKHKSDAVSPVHYVSQDNPPILILHGTFDSLVPYAQSTEFVGALKAKGVDVLLQTLPGSGHGGPAFGKPALATLITNFFDKYLKGANVKVELVPETELAVPPPRPPAK
jgi:acetyl esterase/lipase